jgi:hypothetical protein
MAIIHKPIAEGNPDIKAGIGRFEYLLIILDVFDPLICIG